MNETLAQPILFRRRCPRPAIEIQRVLDATLCAPRLAKKFRFTIIARPYSRRQALAAPGAKYLTARVVPEDGTGFSR